MINIRERKPINVNFFTFLGFFLTIFSIYSLSKLIFGLIGDHDVHRQTVLQGLIVDLLSLSSGFDTVAFSKEILAQFISIWPYQLFQLTLLPGVPSNVLGVLLGVLIIYQKPLAILALRIYCLVKVVEALVISIVTILNALAAKIFFNRIFFSATLVVVVFYGIIMLFNFVFYRIMTRQQEKTITVEVEHHSKLHNWPTILLVAFGAAIYAVVQIVVSLPIMLALIAYWHAEFQEFLSHFFQQNITDRVFYNLQLFITAQIGCLVVMIGALVLFYKQKKVGFYLLFSSFFLLGSSFLFLRYFAAVLILLLTNVQDLSAVITTLPTSMMLGYCLFMLLGLTLVIGAIIVYFLRKNREV